MKEEVDPEAARKLDEEIEKTLREVSKRESALLCVYARTCVRACVCMHMRVCAHKDTCKVSKLRVIALF